MAVSSQWVKPINQQASDSCVVSGSLVHHSSCLGFVLKGSQQNSGGKNNPESIFFSFSGSYLKGIHFKKNVVSALTLEIFMMRHIFLDGDCAL